MCVQAMHVCVCACVVCVCVCVHVCMCVCMHANVHRYMCVHDSYCLKCSQMTVKIALSPFPLS